MANLPFSFAPVAQFGSTPGQAAPAQQPQQANPFGDFVSGLSNVPGFWGLKALDLFNPQPPPSSPDLMGIAGQQMQANRPNQTNAFGANTSWTQGPDGQWTQSQSFGGPLGGLNQSLQSQAAQMMGSPLDFSGLGALTDGAAARDQAINAAYSQATSRLDPQWQQRESQMRTQLLNQGLTEGSEAYTNAMREMGNQRNDAYGSAMNSAIGQGTQAGQALFNQSLMGRQQQIAEMLRQRAAPMEGLQQLQGLSAQPGFAQDNSMMAAALGQGNLDLARWQAQQGAQADMFSGGAQAVGAALPFLLSDERAKTEIERLPYEAIPGVPFATWRYRDEHGGEFGAGVIAQDLQRVAPQYVTEGPDGLLRVNYGFLFEVNHG